MPEAKDSPRGASARKHSRHFAEMRVRRVRVNTGQILTASRIFSGIMD